MIVRIYVLLTIALGYNSSHVEPLLENYSLIVLTVLSVRLVLELLSKGRRAIGR